MAIVIKNDVIQILQSLYNFIYILGATNPADSAPGTIRGDFCIQVGRNICHGSDAVDSAAKEIALWFNEENLVKWDPVGMKWVYEDFEPTV